MLVRMLVLAVFASLAVAGAHALVPSQLTPAEQERYAALKDDPDAAAKFLITREYVRQGKAVVDGTLTAARMPDEPDEFDAQYLFPGETNMLKKAVQKALAAYIDSKSKRR